MAPLVSLPTFASTISSSISTVETLASHASKSVRDFGYVYTYRPKVPASKPVPVNPSPVDGPPPQPSASLLILIFPLPFEKVNGLALINLFRISFLTIILTPLFVSLLCLYLLSL